MNFTVLVPNDGCQTLYISQNGKAETALELSAPVILTFHRPWVSKRQQTEATGCSYSPCSWYTCPHSYCLPNRATPAKEKGTSAPTRINAYMHGYSDELQNCFACWEYFRLVIVLNLRGNIYSWDNRMNIYRTKEIEWRENTYLWERMDIFIDREKTHIFDRGWIYI